MREDDDAIEPTNWSRRLLNLGPAGGKFVLRTVPPVGLHAIEANLLEMKAEQLLMAVNLLDNEADLLEIKDDHLLDLETDLLEMEDDLLDLETDLLKM